MEFDKWEYSLKSAKTQSELNEVLKGLLDAINKDMEDQSLQYLYSTWVSKSFDSVTHNSMIIPEGEIDKIYIVENLIRNATRNIQQIKLSDDVLKFSYLAYYELLSAKHVLHKDPIFSNKYFSKYHSNLDEKLILLSRIIGKYNKV
jgi:hypothetical protein